MTKRQAQTYLDRTKRLLKRWRRVKPIHVDLSVAGENKDGKAIYKLQELNECGSVGCLAGYAYAYAIKDKVQSIPSASSRMFWCERYYGHSYLFLSGPSGAEGHRAAERRLMWWIAELELIVGEGGGKRT